MPVVLGAARSFWLSAFPMLGHSSTRLFWPSSYSLLLCLFAHLSAQTSRIGPLRIGPLGSDPADRILSARAPSAWPLRFGPLRLGPLGSDPADWILSARALSAWPPRLQPLGSAPLCSAPLCSATFGSVPLGSKSSHRTSSARLSSARKPSAASAFGCSHSLPVYRPDTPAFGAWLSRFLAFLAMDYFSRSGALSPHHSVVPVPRLSSAHPLEYSAVSSSAWQLWCSPALIDRSRQRSAAPTLGA